MCSKLPGYSCEKTPIDSNVVPAWDEHFRRDQTFIPTRYKSACELEACFNPLEYSSGCSGKVIEHMHGGGGGGGHGGGGGGHGGGGRGHGGGGRHWGGGRYYGRGGYYGGGGWGWGWPYYDYAYYPPVTTTVVEQRREPNVSMWLFIALIVMILVYVARKR